MPGITKAMDCFSMAAQWQGVPEGVLRAIAMRENVKCDATVRVNTNNSIDTGCMQINSIHHGDLAKYGIDPSELKDQCKNIFIGAWHYRRKINEYGNNAKAVGAYHSKTPSKRDKYAREVNAIWIKYGFYKLDMQ